MRIKDIGRNSSNMEYIRERIETIIGAPFKKHLLRKMFRGQALRSSSPRRQHIVLKSFNVHLEEADMPRPNELHRLLQRHKLAAVFSSLLGTSKTEIEELVSTGVQDLALYPHCAVERVHVAGSVVQHCLLELIMVVGAKREHMAWGLQRRRTTRPLRSIFVWVAQRLQSGARWASDDGWSNIEYNRDICSF